MRHRAITDGRIIATGCVVFESKCSVGRVGAAGSIVKKRECSIGRVAAATTVTKERPCASGGVFVCGVGQERPGTHTCAVVAGGDAQKRIYTNGGVVNGAKNLRGGKSAA